jgi:hypothetical protein
MNKEKKIRFFSGIKAFKVIDFVIQNALVVVLIQLVAYEAGRIAIKTDILAQVLIIIFICFLLAHFYRFSKKDEHGVAEMRFDGDINQLVLKMVAVLGLHLKSKISDYYTFTSGNKIMPNVEYTVRDCGKYCMIIAPEGQFYNINSLLCLESSQNEVGK